MVFSQTIFEGTIKIVSLAVQTGKISSEPKDITKYFEEIYTGIYEMFYSPANRQSAREIRRITEEDFDDLR